MNSLFHRPRAGLWLGALLTLPLAACSGFGLSSKAAVVQTYVLQVPVGAQHEPRSEATNDTAETLAISRPTAATGLDTERIAVVRADGRLDYYSASRWAGDLPDVLHTLLIDAQRDGGGWRAVLPDTSAFTADELLQVEVRDFQAQYPAAGTPTVHVRLEGTLGRRNQREVLRTVHAESSVPASTDRMTAVVAAFNAALADALKQLGAQLQPQKVP